MSSGNPALSLDEVFLTPPALEPPPVRRGLFIFLLLLTALLHVATIGWDAAHSGSSAIDKQADTGE